MEFPDPLFTHAQRLIQRGRRGEAILLVNQRAAGGDASAWFTLAVWKWEGIVVPRDLPQARLLFERAGGAGHRISNACSTNLLASGVAGKRDWARAVTRLKDEARQDPDRRAASNLLRKMGLSLDGEPSEAIPPARQLSAAPEVYLFPQLFSHAECDHLARAAAPHLGPSYVFDPDSGQSVRDPVRTSDGSELHWFIEDPAAHALNRRLARASDTAVDQGEPLQILRYSPGQQYQVHMDAVHGLPNQRVLTALVYLNDDYAGGETSFERTGLRVKGNKGDTVIFRNVLPNGMPDPLSEHAGLPVLSGTKLLASRWIHQHAILPRQI